MAARTQAAIGVTIGVWLLAVLATFILTASAANTTIWQAFGAAGIVGAILGMIGGLVIIINWRELQLP